MPMALEGVERWLLTETVFQWRRFELLSDGCLHCSVSSRLLNLAAVAEEELLFLMASSVLSHSTWGKNTGLQAAD